MKSIDALTKLKKLGQSFFKTSDASVCWQVPNAHASKILSRLMEAGQIAKISRSLWAIGTADPLEAAIHLSAPQPSYISLQTALFFHGIISQIPTITYAVTTGRTRKINTSIGRISFHHVSPDFFFGFKVFGSKNILMAEPEKALIDILYLKPARSRLFQALPEVTFSKEFSRKRAQKIVGTIHSCCRRTLVQNGLKKMIEEEHKKQ